MPIDMGEQPACSAQPGDEAGKHTPPVDADHVHLDPDTIQQVLDGIVPLDEASAIGRHLQQCVRCRALVDTLSAASGMEVSAATVTRTLATPAPGMAPLAPGTVVDHFVVERLVGRGGMGEVYLARDDTLGRPVALKVISPGYLGSYATRQRFLLEARTTARFNHPHIVSIYAVGEHAGRPYMALEYLEGLTLREHMARTVPSAEEAIRLGLPIARALAEAHQHGVLHRDLKPGNIMLPADGRLRVLDFGLAKGLASTGDGVGAKMEDVRVTASGLQSLAGGESTTVKSRFLGTPAYMAPEQWREEPIGPETDMWAFGLVLYQLVTGRRPYHGVPLQHIPDAVAGLEPVPSVSQVAGDLPKDLAALIDQCLRKVAAERPSSKQAVERLEALYTRLVASESGASRAQAGVDRLGTGGRGAERGGVPDVPVFGRAARPWASVLRRLAARVGWKAPAVGVALGLILVTALTLATMPTPAVRPAGPVVRIGLYPASPTTDAARELAPLLRYLEASIARPIDVEVAPSYRALRTGLEAGSYDFGMLPPVQYVLARHARSDVTPVAYARYDSASQGLLVVPAESGIETVADLAGKRICYVDRGSTSGYLFPRLYLREQGYDPDTLFSRVVFSGAHVQAIMDLLAGRCDVAAVYSEAFMRAFHVDQGFQRKVQILTGTRAIPSDMFCAAPDTDSALVATMRKALLGFVAEEVLGTTAVSDVYPYTITEFTEPSDAVFESVEQAARLEGVLPASRSGSPGGVP